MLDPRDFKYWLSTLLLASLVIGTPIACGPSKEDEPPDEPEPGETESWEILKSVVVGPEGAPVSTSDDDFYLFIPENALAEPTEIRILVPADDQMTQALHLEGRYPIPNTRVRIEPADVELREDVLLVIRSYESEVPVRATGGDLGIYHGQRVPDEPLPETITSSSSHGHLDFGGGRSTTQRLSFTAMISEFSTFEVAIHDPYAEPPVLKEIWAGLQTLLSDQSGAHEAFGWRWSSLTLRGHGFGWDNEVFEVLFDGQPAESGIVRNQQVSFQLNIPDALISDTTYTVQVRVKGRASNTLQLRVAADSSCTRDLEELRPPQGAAGMSIRVYGNYCGTADTRIVHFGDQQISPYWNEEVRAMYFTVPSDAELGWHEVSMSDGLGSPPGGSFPFYVFPSDPIELRPGLDGHGLALSGFIPSVLSHYPIILGVSNLEPYIDIDMQHPQRLMVRFETPYDSTDWLYASDADNIRPACEGLESGTCIVRLPVELLTPLEEGDFIRVTLRMKRRAGSNANTEDGWFARDSQPFEVPITSIAIPGTTQTIYVGDDSYQRPFCAYESDTATVAAGDTVCLAAIMTSCDVGGSCDDWPHIITAPTIFAGELQMSNLMNGGLDSGFRNWCFKVTETGTHTITNHTLQRSCTLEVKRWAPSWEASLTVPHDFEQDLVLGSGGARLRIPAGALPPIDSGEYQITLRMNAVGEESGTDPVRQVEQALRIQISPPVHALHAPLNLTIPVDPPSYASGSPELGLIDPHATMVHFIDAATEIIQDVLTWEIPAGRWGTLSDATHLPVVMPVPVNVALSTVGVIFRRVEPGLLEDANRRIQVDYVADPSSSHHVSEDTALVVLNAAVEAYEFLQDWRRPEEIVRIFIRERVSWADFSGRAEGATTKGWLGQPTVVIRSTLPNDAAFRYVTVHEMGHVFQRNYTTPALTQWVDEAASEWVAWSLLGDEFPIMGMQESACAVEIASKSFPSSWRGVSSDCIYATVAWLIWLQENVGGNVVRSIYETVSAGAEGSDNPRRVFEQVSGLSISDFSERFAEDFWTHALPAAQLLPLSALQVGYGQQVSHELNQPQSLAISLHSRPPLSSVRYRVSVTADALDSPLYAGYLVLRARGLRDPQQVHVYHEDRAWPDPRDLEPIATLTAFDSHYILPFIEEGAYWIVDNNSSESISATDNTFILERPRITSLSPTAAGAGQTVTVSGQYFGDGVGTLIVGGQTVASTHWQPSQVRFVMPEFANTSTVSVVMYTHENARTNEVMLDVIQGD